MRKLIVLIIAALLLPIVFAAPSVDYSVNPTTPKVGQDYVITITASDPAGIDSIVNLADSSTTPCGGRDSCSATYRYSQNTAGQYTYNFYARPSGSGQGVQKTVTVTVSQASGSTSDTSGGTQQTTPYTTPGAQAGAGPNVKISLVGEASPGKEFILRSVATTTDSRGIDSINWLNPRTASYEQVPCGGRPECSADWKVTEIAPGTYVYDFKVRGANGQATDERYTITMGPSGVAPASTGSPSSSSGGSSSGGGGIPGPNINVKISPAEPVIGDVVTFDGTGTTSQSGTSIRNYAWDFNGDDQVDASGPNPIVTYTYQNEGTYKVRIEVTDSNSMTTYAYRTLNVKSCCRITTGSVAEGLGDFGSITVNVNDNGPIIGANVNLLGPQSYATQTDLTGRAYFQVQPGCYDVTVESEGKDFDRQNICVEAGESKDVAMGLRSASVGGNVSWLYIIAAIIIIAAIGGGVYYYMNQEPVKKEQTFKGPKPGFIQQSSPGKNELK